MVRISKTQPANSITEYSVRCDSTGRTGGWKCENLAPRAVSRDAACGFANAVGWTVVGSKWYCPQCQCDGFVPTKKPAKIPDLHAN